MLRLDVSMLDSLQSGGRVSVKVGCVHVGFPTEWVGGASVKVGRVHVGCPLEKGGG